MSNPFETLIGRNHEYASDGFEPGLALMPSLRTLVISCADPRVDPAHLLGLRPGEALVIRNIGGRIAPSTLQAMGMLQAIARVEGVSPATPFNLIVLHHTDCGITRLEGNPEVLSGYFGVPQSELKARAISDPHAAVAFDVAALKALGVVPRTWSISGLVYDVHTGLIETVVAPNSAV